MKIKELCSDERPREKLLTVGPQALSNAELVAIILRTGTRGDNAVDIARKLVSRTEGKLHPLASMSIDKLKETRGIGTDKAVALAAAFELGKRYGMESSAPERFSVQSSSSAFGIMRHVMKGLQHEECWVMFLNRANYVTGKEKISSGGTSSTVIDAKIIVKKAVEKLASGIILFHNHPSGNPRPGTVDLKETEKLKKALDLFGISLLDHIIVADDRYYSFSDEKVTVVPPMP